MCSDMCSDMRLDMCLDMCSDICLDMCSDMYLGASRPVFRRVFRHAVYFFCSVCDTWLMFVIGVVGSPTGVYGVESVERSCCCTSRCLCSDMRLDMCSVGRK